MPSRPSSPGLFAEPPQPDRGWVTAHCDGGARGNPGPAGYGAVITGANGELLAELSEFLGVRTNNFAEYSGLLGVLAYALEHGHRRLRVVSDSELMVKQIQGRYKVNSPDLKPLWQEAKARIAKLDGFEISHALRHKNKDADRLANEAMDRGMKKPRAAGEAEPPLKATPYPQRSEAPADQYIHSGAGKAGSAETPAMLRGFTRGGVVHVLGSHTLPDGIFVKIIRE
jgi:probable phosphoglycerate mutase